MSEPVRAATRQGVSVGVAVGAYGVSFGALSVAAGLDVWQTCLLSLLMFTGGSQFAFVGVVGAGGAGAAATAAAALLGVRNLLYSLQVAPLLALPATVGGRLRRLAAAHVTIDESTAVAIAQDDADARRRGFWVTGLAVFALWNLTTLAGALLGDVLGDPRRFGLDGAAAAAFLALLWPRLRSADARAVGAAAAVLAAVAVPFTPPGVPVLVAGAAAALTAGWQLRRDAGRGPDADPLPEGPA